MNEVEGVMNKIDVVVHFAAESHVDRAIMNPMTFVKTNVIGTYVLLEQALKSKIKRFHHVSTDECFGSLKLGEEKRFDETTSYNPKNPYSATKASSDHLVRAYFNTYGLDITISSCSNNFGPYQFPEKFIPLIITNLIDDKKVPVYGDGLYVRDWLYVEDHCKAIELILKKGRSGETYCVGGMTEDVSNIEVVKKILDMLGRDESYIGFVRDRPGHDRRYAIDWSKINRDLGWKPEHDFNGWLEKTVRWYKDNKDWWERVKNKEYLEYYEKQYAT